MSNQSMAGFAIVFSCLATILIPRVHSMCINKNVVTLSGENVTDIPRDLPKDVTILYIRRTSINVLNLTTAIENCPGVCRITMESSPVKHIIIPSNPPGSMAVKELIMVALDFPTPPDFGSVLPEKLEMLYLRRNRITTVPSRYFQDYSNLITLSMAINRITTLTVEQFLGHGRLQILDLQHNDLSTIPHAYQLLPNLQRLGVQGNHITEIPVALLENLSHLRILTLVKKRTQTVPGQKHFINLENMTSIDLRGNPLHCDYQLCWIKVNTIW